MEASPQGNRRCFACGKGATARLGACGPFGYHFDGSIVYAHLKHAQKARALAELPFGAFLVRDVGFRPETALLYVSENEAHAKNYVENEVASIEKSGYAVVGHVRRLTYHELRTWHAAGNKVLSGRSL